MAQEVKLSLAAIPEGRLTSVDLNGEEVVVARVGGRCYALGGICTHDGAPLADGELDGTTLTCPWHFTEFDVTTGKVIEGMTDDPLPVFVIEIKGDEVTIRKD